MNKKHSLYKKLEAKNDFGFCEHFCSDFGSFLDHFLEHFSQSSTKWLTPNDFIRMIGGSSDCKRISNHYHSVVITGNSHCNHYMYRLNIIANICEAIFSSIHCSLGRLLSHTDPLCEKCSKKWSKKWSKIWAKVLTKTMIWWNRFLLLTFFIMNVFCSNKF